MRTDADAPDAAPPEDSGASTDTKPGARAPAPVPAERGVVGPEVRAFAVLAVAVALLAALSLLPSLIAARWGASESSPREQLLREHPKLEPLLDEDPETLTRIAASNPRLRRLLQGQTIVGGGLMLGGLSLLLVWLILCHAQGRDPLAREPFRPRSWGVGVAVIFAIATLLQQPLFVVALAAVLIVRIGYEATWKDFGLTSAGTGRAVWVAVLAFVAIFPITRFAWVWMAALLKGVGQKPDLHPAIPTILTAPGSHIVPLLLLVLVAAPIVEEFVFRGVIQAGLRRKLGPLAAITVTALLFALVHGNVVDRPALFLLAAMMGYVYERTGSLIAPMVVHLLNNALSIGGLLVMREMAAELMGS